MDNICIREVWASNLDEEMQTIAGLLDAYPYVGMDTEFPGVVATTDSPNDYELIRRNASILKLIQFGITLSDGNGRMPVPFSTWQFNFQFDIGTDLSSSESISMLQEHGIDFARFAVDGIDPIDFGHLLVSSGLVYNDRIRYITYHGTYDFAYLMKAVRCRPLPTSAGEFLEELIHDIPHFIDIKNVAYDRQSLTKSGLSKLADELNIIRIGAQHQAGSDSLVTLMCFMALAGKGSINDLFNRYDGRIYGIQTPRSMKGCRMR